MNQTDIDRDEQPSAAHPTAMWTYGEHEQAALLMQSSGAMQRVSPALAASDASVSNVRGATGPFAARSPRPRQGRRIPRTRLMLLAVLLLLLVSGAAVAFFPGSTIKLLPGMQMPLGKPMVMHTAAPTMLPTRPTPMPTAAMTMSDPTSWVPQALPAGWTRAGLSSADALEAEWVGETFTSREMLIDYRSVGTPNTHGGTFTASTFILDNAARARFAANDKRASAAFLAAVQREQLIQIPINPLPRLMQFQAQGNGQFAWVVVSFQLQFQHGANGQATLDPTIHQMAVLLMRVPLGTPSNPPPMGGIGWLVSDYALDMAALPAIPAQP